MLRVHRAGWSRLVVLSGLAGFVVWVYVVVVLGGGALIGQTDSPSMPLSVLATTVVALLFARVQAAIEGATIRWGRGAPRPYDVLSQFSDSVTSAYATDELPARMAILLAQGTGARWAQVWLTVSDRLTLAATWPPDVNAERMPPPLRPEDAVVTDGAVRALPVRHGGQLLGVLRLQERPGLALTLVEERLFAGLAAQAGLVLTSVRLRAELDDRRAELLVRAEEIRASRERLIETQDAERRRLERDLHDGAQQHLVALTVNLRLAHTIVDRSPGRAAVVVAEQAVAALVGDRDAFGPVPRDLPEAAGRRGPRRSPAVRRRGVRIPVTIDTDGMARLPARRRGRALLLLHRSSAERREALRGRPVVVRVERRTRRAGSSPSPTTATASTRPAPLRLPEWVWRTCATAWTRSAERWRSHPSSPPAPW